jgi:hypothetical protein
MLEGLRIPTRSLVPGVGYGRTTAPQLLGMMGVRLGS